MTGQPPGDADRSLTHPDTTGHSWPALVLTAGLGTRLRPLSYVRAKPAMPVAGQPLVCRILSWLASHGVRDVVLNLHYKPHTITEVVGDGSAFGVRVRYSPEEPILGSAGGPRQALALLDSPRFFIVNGDTLTNVDLDALRREHESNDALVSMALVEQPDPGHYGGVKVAADGSVTGFVRKGSPSRFHFVGIQAADARAFNDVPAGQPRETVSWLYPRLVEQQPGSVRGFLCQATFHDIGTPRDYLHTSLRIAQAERRPLPLVGAGCSIDRTATIEDSVLWDDVVLESGATVRRSVVADGVRIPAGAELDGVAVVRRPFADYEPDAGEQLSGNIVIKRI